MNFEEVTRAWQKEAGVEQHVLNVTPECWISVLHRLTGFGYWECETTIVTKGGEPDILLLRGDHRESLLVLLTNIEAASPEVKVAFLRTWYDAYIEENMTSVQTAMALLKSRLP